MLDAFSTFEHTVPACSIVIGILIGISYFILSQILHFIRKCEIRIFRIINFSIFDKRYSGIVKNTIRWKSHHDEENENKIWRERILQTCIIYFPFYRYTGKVWLNILWTLCSSVTFKTNVSQSAFPKSPFFHDTLCILHKEMPSRATGVNSYSCVVNSSARSQVSPVL